jgi:hypothetical protein
LCLAAVRHPFACHTRIIVTTKSRPLRFVRNSALACPPHSDTVTPYGSFTTAVFPRVRSTQIAHTGCFTGTPLALYNVANDMPDSLPDLTSQHTTPPLTIRSQHANGIRSDRQVANPLLEPFAPK